jgi:hypothetical protein
MHEQNASMSWISQNWIKILLFFAGAIFVIGILKILSQLFNSNGPLANGLANILGAAANLVNGIINGCTSQGDCTKSSEQDSCNKINGCEWDPGDAKATPSTTASCLNTSGRSPGGGGFFSGSCVLGMGSIFALCGALLFFVIGPALAYAFRKSNENIKAASETSGKSEGQIWKETVEETVKEYDRTVKEYEKDNPGKELSDNAKELVVKRIAIEKSASKLKESVDSNSSLNIQERAAKKAAGDAARTKMHEQVEEEAVKDGVSQEDIDIAKEIVPPEPLE